MEGSRNQSVQWFDHPGEGIRRTKPTPKSRQIYPHAQEEIEAILGEQPRRRDLLIEYLHLIQDKCHQIYAAHLAALAEAMKLSLAEVFETATFYTHFDVVKENDPPVPSNWHADQSARSHREGTDAVS